ncbi:MAG: glycosyltransferase family 9 protein [Sphingobacteriaceae bacterium]|nr:glycosyltransferase family 9 protein [Sphingobacteriaceae bacterium]
MAIKNRNKFRLTRFVIFKVSRIFKILSSIRTSERRLLVIKLDAIGDYVLFRNYLEVLTSANKYKGYKIDVLGNIQWKDIAVKFDSKHVSEFIFTDAENLYEKPIHTLKLGYKLFKKNYEVVLQPTYSRTLIANGLCGLAAAKESIAYNNPTEKRKYKKRTDKFYTSLLTLPETIFHELERHLYFFKQVLDDESIQLKGPLFPVSKTESKGIVLFPGSSFHKRNWEKKRFLEIIKRLLLHTSEPIIIAGGPLETELASYLIDNLPEGSNVINKAGKLGLVDFISMVANSKLLITNETSAVHIAASCQTKSICILGGGHFNRFTPYPEAINYELSCVYYEMPCFNCDWVCKFITEPDDPFPCISNIDIENVWSEVVQAIYSDKLL